MDEKIVCNHSDVLLIEGRNWVFVLHADRREVLEPALRADETHDVFVIARRLRSWTMNSRGHVGKQSPLAPRRSRPTDLCADTRPCSLAGCGKSPKSTSLAQPLCSSGPDKPYTFVWLGRKADFFRSLLGEALGAQPRLLVSAQQPAMGMSAY